MHYVAGIDIGSGQTKCIVLDVSGEEPIVVGRGIMRTGVNLEGAANEALALARGSIEAIDYVATTGFGRYGYASRDIQITEITSAARGAKFLVPEASALLDIGSQSTRAVAVTPEGRVRTFKANDKCAAGSGSFITRACKYLEVNVEEVGELAMSARSPQPISSICAVLAESEIINHVSAGVSVDNIVRGVYDSLAERAAMLLRRIGAGGDVTLIGGVALQRGMAAALEQRLGVRVHVPEACQYACALGAALLGAKRLEATLAA